MAKSPLYLRASLLDRLIDYEPKQRREPVPLRAQQIHEFQQSLLRDLNWLLTTHCPVSATELETREQRSVIDYGLPDLTMFYTDNPEDQRLVEHLLSETIQAFEPRLRDVRVYLKKSESYDTLSGFLEADLVLDDVLEPISFPLQFSQKNNQWALGFNTN